MLALKMLVRDWRSGQLGLIASSLVLAVAVVTGVALFAERVEHGLVAQSSNFLAADRAIASGLPIPAEIADKAESLGLETGQIISFTSMAFHGDDMHLASVKAVSGNYPLRGLMELSDQPFAFDAVEERRAAPSQGEVWADSRLLPLLNVELGGTVEIGEAQFKLSKIIVNEPDRGSGFTLYGARLMINAADLPATDVLQPGSRASYRLLIAGDTSAIDQFDSWAESSLSPHERLITPDEAQEGISTAIDRGRTFLLLAGCVGLLLAGVALALASDRYATRHVQQVALLKSFGTSARKIRSLYLQQGLWLALIGTLLGVALGWGFQLAVLKILAGWIPLTLPAAGPTPYLVGIATGFACLLGFAMPPIWRLPSVPPLRVLRKDVPVSGTQTGVRAAIGLLTLAVLIWAYSGQFGLTWMVLAGYLLIGLLGSTFGLMLLRVGRSASHWAGSVWRLAIANLWRRRGQTLFQINAFAVALMLLLVMVTLRTSLLDEWRVQLPDDSPNHFLVNVSPQQQPAVEALLERDQLTTSGWYPMVRGRLVAINGDAPTQQQKDRNESLNRELNLSWSEQLPADNSIVSGQWWSQPLVEGEPIPVSVETDLIDEIGLKLGDTLTFSIGGLSFDAVIVSSRALNWDTMRPNFYFLFQPGGLPEQLSTYMTSVYIPQQNKPLVNELLQAHPTVLVIELDKIFERIRDVVTQVTQGLELMSLLILGCGILVLFSAVNSTLDERLQEAAVLRTFGSPRKLLLGNQAIEFTAMGLIAGVMAAVGSELVSALLQIRLFQIDWQLHPLVWLVGPVAGAIIVGGLGVWRAMPAVNTPPLNVLRRLLDS